MIGYFSLHEMICMVSHKKLDGLELVATGEGIKIQKKGK
jgi:hypothetical protein